MSSSGSDVLTSDGSRRAAGGSPDDPGHSGAVAAPGWYFSALAVLWSDYVILNDKGMFTHQTDNASVGKPDRTRVGLIPFGPSRQELWERFRQLDPDLSCRPTSASPTR